MDKQVDIWIPGIPKPAGSKRGFYNPKLKRVIITDDNRKSKDWITVVAQIAAEAAQGREVLDGPLAARFDFVFPRPKGHFKSDNTSLRSSAPAYPVVKPDATKVLRSTEDALKGILWRDDSQIVTQFVTKRYGEQPGARIRVRPEVV